MTKRDFRNQLWTLSQAERARVLLESVAASRAKHEHDARDHGARVSLPTGYGAAVDSLNANTRGFSGAVRQVS